MEEKTTVSAQTSNVPIFAMNPRRKNDTGKVMGKYHRGYAEPATAEQVKNRLTAKDVKEDVRLIQEEGREELKDEGLFTLCPHYSQFKDNHRCQACIIPEAFTYDTCVDVDEKELVEQAIKRALEVNQDPMSDWQDMVLYVEYSPRKKVHIWLRLPVGKTIEEAQKDFCSEIEIPFDTSCITPERYINMTGDVVYVSDRWLQPLSEKEIEERREAYLMRGLDVDGRPLVGNTSQRCGSVEVQQQSQKTSPTTIVPANARTLYIVRECLKEAELEEKDLNTLGGIHNAVKSMLSVGATQLLSQGELLGVLKELMPQYWQDQNIVQLVTDFYAKYTDTSQKMNQFQRRLFARSRKVSDTSLSGVGQTADKQAGTGTAFTQDNTPVFGDSASLTDIYRSPCPPVLSKQARPAFVKAATAPVPAESKETAAQAMFPPLGMYCDASFVYDDGTPREPRLNCLITAGTGSGKDSSTKHMLMHLEAPRQQDDEPNRKILSDWKAECKRLESKNEDKPPRPNVAVRSVAANITQARLSELMADSQGRIIHTRMIEFDQWFAVEGWKPGTNCPFTYLKMTDDEGNPFGQERVGKDSITYRGPLSINWNASTTTAKAQYYFRNVMTDGPISRLCLATTPDRGLGAPMPKHGRYDEKYDASLKPFIDNLRKAQGLINCKQAVRMVRDLKKELDDFSVQTGDALIDNLGHRALVIVFRKACLLYAANGMKWERSITGFCRWSLHYDLWLKLHFYGDLIRSADGEVKTSHRGPRNLLEQLPQEFTRQQVASVRQLAGMDEEGTSKMLAQWKYRGYILQITDYSFRKTTCEEQEKEREK